MNRRRYKKSFRTKRKKSLFKNRFFWLAVLFLLSVGFLFYFFLLSSFFKIKEIKILGNQKIPTKEIKDIVDNKTKGIFSRNILFLKSGKIKKAISQKFILAADADLKKDFFSKKMFIKIKERVPLAVWCPIFGLNFQKAADKAGGNENKEEKKEEQKKENYCFNLDKEGIIFEKSGKKEGLIIKSEKEAKVGDKVIEQRYLKDILDIYDKSEKELKIKIKEFFMGRENKILTVRTFQGWEAYFNPRGDISSQIFNLKMVLEKQISSEKREKLEYIDLRFGNRVFYK